MARAPGGTADGAVGPVSLLLRVVLALAQAVALRVSAWEPLSTRSFLGFDTRAQPEDSQRLTLLASCPPYLEHHCFMWEENPVSGGRVSAYGALTRKLDPYASWSQQRRADGQSAVLRLIPWLPLYAVYVALTHARPRVTGPSSAGVCSYVEHVTGCGLTLL